jgi:hypothetical protein
VDVVAMIISDGHGTRCPGTDEMIFFHGTSETRYFPDLVPTVPGLRE